MAIPKEYERYSWQDYLSWDESERWELIEGVAWSMSPSPGIDHQDYVFNIGRQLGDFLEDKTCRVHLSPLDVKLSTAEEDEAPTVVQPDLFVGCDPDKIIGQNFVGAPDLILEVVSPSSGLRDRRDKYRLYEKHGVMEYWILDPDGKVLEIHRLKEGKYVRIGAYGAGDEVVTPILPGFKLDLERVFKSRS